MVAPSRRAVTSTPSIAPSCAEETTPARAVCACAAPAVIINASAEPASRLIVVVRMPSSLSSFSKTVGKIIRHRAGRGQWPRRIEDAAQRPMQQPDEDAGNADERGDHQEKGRLVHAAPQAAEPAGQEPAREAR